MKDKLASFFRSRVEVRANNITYRGFLVGADEDHLYLKGETMWITLPMLSVTAVRREGEEEGEWVRKKVEGEPQPDPALRESKRRYRREDFDEVHQPDDNLDWPDGKAEKTAGEEPDSEAEK